MSTDSRAYPRRLLGATITTNLLFQVLKKKIVRSG